MQTILYDKDIYFAYYLLLIKRCFKIVRDGAQYFQVEDGARDVLSFQLQGHQFSINSISLEYKWNINEI